MKRFPPIVQHQIRTTGLAHFVVAVIITIIIVKFSFLKTRRRTSSRGVTCCLKTFTQDDMSEEPPSFYLWFQLSLFYLFLCVTYRNCQLTGTYKVGSRWKNEVGGMVERHWQMTTNALGGKKKLSHYNFVHHRTDMDWPRTEPGPPR